MVPGIYYKRGKLYQIDSKIIADQVRAIRSSNAQANSLLPGAIPQKKKSVQFTGYTNVVGDVAYQHSTVGPYFGRCPYSCSFSVKYIKVRNMNFYILRLHNYKNNKRFRGYKNQFFFYFYIRINPINFNL